MTEGQRRKVLEMSEVPGGRYPGVYVLGSFAKYVTLCSQQVRALNLVAALCDEGRIKENTEVAVIGGGAAGLTAAAAAAVCKAKVLLLDELDGFMELQRNNRQRWLHPHIYDWPDMEFDSEDAKLPLLNWKAGYAENVVRQIENGWESVRATTSIDARTQARYVRLTAGTNATTLTWDGGKGKFPVIIVAVGFGLEPKTEVQDSYWTEDDIDGSFRKSAHGQRWLISGSGDGAFTDLMRLCIRRFRHAEIKDVFASEPGYLGVIDDLREIHRNSDISDEELSQKFESLSVDKLQSKLATRLRTDGPEVLLTSKTIHLYGHGASILNRLIVLLLSPARLGAFTFLPGPYVDYRRVDSVYEVRLGERDATEDRTYTETVHRVILRHGPEPSLRQGLLPLRKACNNLVDRWGKLRRQEDFTRARLWPATMFPERRVAEVTDTSAREFEEAVQEVGVRAAALTIRKELRGDNSCTVSLEIDRLSVEHGELRGLRVYYESTVGHVSPVELDSSAIRLGIVPQDDYKPPEGLVDPLGLMRDRARKLAVILSLPWSWTHSDPPLRFGLSFTVLNGDALSDWEFEQMYAPKDRVHINDRRLEPPTEFLARIVWFPIEHLRIRITLPDRPPKDVLPSVFVAENAGNLATEEIIRDGILLLYPAADSRYSAPAAWQEQPSTPLIEAGRLARPSPQTWELTVYRPPVGSCYSLDWVLPASRTDERCQALDRAAGEMRKRLLAYGNARRTDASSAAIGKCRLIVQRLYEALHKIHATDDPNERFAVTLLTYQASERQLVVVDGLVNGEELTQALWDFRLPFGLGLAGACFKQGNNPYMYIRPSSETPPFGSSYYLPVPGTEYQEVLLAIPLRIPGASNPPQGCEASRQCAAILDIGSSSEMSKLRSLVENRNELYVLAAQCQDVFDAFCGALPDLI